MASRAGKRAAEAPATKSVETFNPLKDINTWWFGYGSPVALGVFRIVISSLTFLTLGLTGLDFAAWYTDRGFAPADVIYNNWAKFQAVYSLGPGNLHRVPFMDTFPRLDLIVGVHDVRIVAAFYTLVLIFALLTALGLWTRFSSICLALGVVSIQHRDPLILMSGDTLLRICVIYLAFAPSGLACSLDRVIGLWKGTAPPEPPRVSLWPQRLIQYQVAVVYFTTVWWKWFGTDWKDGTATFFPENLNQFNRFPAPDLMRHQPFIGISTYGTLIVELSLATLVFYKPLRKYVLLAGIGMHGYIEYHFNIPFFGWIIVSTYVCFYEGDEISAWAKRLGDRLRRWRVLVELPIGKKLRPQSQVALQALDPFSLVSYDPGVGADWSAVDLEAKHKKPFRASWIRSVGAWPMGLVPGLWKRTLAAGIVDAEPAPETTAQP